MSVVLKIDQGMYALDLMPFQKYVSWHYLNDWFPSTPGESHPPLLAYLSSQLPKGSKVADLGTQYGASALALAYNPDVKVTTYDVADCIPSDAKVTIRSVPNIQCVLGSCFDYIDNYSDSQIIFLDIAPHNGSDERFILSELVKRNYTGLLICDDIHLSEAMESFWRDVSFKKHDVTPYGHWSGTGVIVFDPKTLDVRIS